MILNPNYTHLLRFNKRNRIAKLAEKMFDIFWQVILDTNPTFCFLCGKYIPPFEREEINIKQPYKKGDVCHESCWKLFVNMEHLTNRLNDNSELICHVDLGWVVKPKICRDRVLNRPDQMMQHLIDKHDWALVPELAYKELEKIHENNVEAILRAYGKQIKENYLKWFHDNQLNFDSFKKQHFLKPDGKPFPKVRYE